MSTGRAGSTRKLYWTAGHQWGHLTTADGGEQESSWECPRWFKMMRPDLPIACPTRSAGLPTRHQGLEGNEPVCRRGVGLAGQGHHIESRTGAKCIPDRAWIGERTLAFALACMVVVCHKKTKGAWDWTWSA